MSPQEVVSQVNTKFQAAISRFKNEIKKLQTGRAHPSMLDGVSAEAYGRPMPLIQLATISAPEAQLLQITPFDPSNLKAIAEAIRENQSLGMNPTDDGRIIRVPIPPLTEERRQQIAKQLREKVEESLISMRNARREAHHNLEKARKDKDISEDEFKRFSSQVDEALTKKQAELENIARRKESEIMTV